MSKKYEIVNVGGVNRVRALRSWMVQGRQVNVGDVGGSVFDERTLSQDGDAWIFSGRFDNPLVRVGGDSVVNIGETAPVALPFVNIFGTSSLDANFNVNFSATVVNNTTPLTPAMMEQGRYDGVIGKKVIRAADAAAIRKTNRIFTGGAGFSVPAPAKGYAYKMTAVDADDIVTYVTTYLTGAGTVPAGAHSYVYLTVAKSPAAATVPADVTEAALTFPDRREATINIVDSHITLTGQNARYVLLDPSVSNGENTTNIVGSTVNVTRTAGTPVLYFVCDLINTNATINMTTAEIGVLGVYKNVKNLVWSTVNWARDTFFRTGIQCTDCDNFVMDGVNINASTGTAIQNSGLPLIFTRCNMNNARIVNQPLINNTYEDINFDLATADLGKYTASSITHLVSSNVNGMYRLREGTGGIGALVETHESVKDLSLVSASYVAETYNTTIYADAYLKGSINLRGTNVFGNAVKKPKTRTIDASRMAVQGAFSPVAVGQPIGGISANANKVIIPIPFKTAGILGLSVKGVTGTDLRFLRIVTDAKGVIASLSATYSTDQTMEGASQNDFPFVYLQFSNLSGTAITPADLAGVTITTYEGCKVVNTKATAMVIAGNVRVEENAVLKDTSIDGTGYFGGDSVTETPVASTAPQPINGYAFMTGKAVFSPTSFSSSSSITRLHMQDNARMTGAVASANVNLVMKDDAEYNGQLYGICDIRLEDRTVIPANLGVTASSYGKFTMKGKASLGNNITIKGDITLCDNFRNTVVKIYSGKRVIDSQDAPVYDNNVRTKYDF